MYTYNDYHLCMDCMVDDLLWLYPHECLSSKSLSFGQFSPWHNTGSSLSIHHLASRVLRQVHLLLEQPHLLWAWFHLLDQCISPGSEPTFCPCQNNCSPRHWIADVLATMNQCQNPHKRFERQWHGILAHQDRPEQLEDMKDLWCQSVQSKLMPLHKQCLHQHQSWQPSKSWSKWLTLAPVPAPCNCYFHIQSSSSPRWPNRCPPSCCKANWGDQTCKSSEPCTLISNQRGAREAQNALLAMSWCMMGSGNPYKLVPSSKTTGRLFPSQQCLPPTLLKCTHELWRAAHDRVLGTSQRSPGSIRALHLEIWAHHLELFWKMFENHVAIVMDKIPAKNGRWPCQDWRTAQTVKTWKNNVNVGSGKSSGNLCVYARARLHKWTRQIRQDSGATRLARQAREIWKDGPYVVFAKTQESGGLDGHWRRHLCTLDLGLSRKV